VTEMCDGCGFIAEHAVSSLPENRHYTWAEPHTAEPVLAMTVSISVTIFHFPSMLVFNSLVMHLVFPNRILVTRTVEVDEVPFIRNF
jgi:hypothetical protein